jgi:adenylate cyclase
MDLVAWSSSDPQKRWRRPLPGGSITLGRKAELSSWDVPWDRQVSGLHATLTWQDGKLLVRKEPKAINRIYFQGTPCDEFALSAGEQFTIGGTIFALQEEAESAATDLPSPELELTCTRQELQQLRFPDADERIEVLSALPGMIRFSPGDAEFEERVLAAVLQGIPGGCQGRGTRGGAAGEKPRRPAGGHPDQPPADREGHSPPPAERAP